MINRRLLMTIIVVVLAVLIGISFLINGYVSKKDNLKILVAPKNATITLGDKTIPGDTSTYITPGTYPLSITANNFSSVKQEVTITNTFSNLVFCLTPTNMSQEDYFTNHPEDRYTCEGAAGQNYNKDAQAAIQQYPILAHLPYNDGTFSVGQGLTDDKKGTALYIHYSSDKSKGEALDWVNRFSPDKLPPIIYVHDYYQTGRLGGEGSELDTILVDKYPIIKSLPLDAAIYKLGYRIDESDPSGHSIKLTIDSDTASGRIAALREIQSLGYPPTNFKIEFLNFESDLQ